MARLMYAVTGDDRRAADQLAMLLAPGARAGAGVKFAREAFLLPYLTARMDAALAFYAHAHGTAAEARHAIGAMNGALDTLERFDPDWLRDRSAALPRFGMPGAADAATRRAETPRMAAARLAHLRADVAAYARALAPVPSGTKSAVRGARTAALARPIMAASDHLMASIGRSPRYPGAASTRNTATTALSLLATMLTIEDEQFASASECERGAGRIALERYSAELRNALQGAKGDDIGQLRAPALRLADLAVESLASGALAARRSEFDGRGTLAASRSGPRGAD